MPEMLLLRKICPCEGENKHASSFSLGKDIEKHLPEDEAALTCRYQTSLLLRGSFLHPLQNFLFFNSGSNIPNTSSEDEL